MGKSKKTNNGKRRAIRFETAAIPAPSWNSPAEAIAYLRGPFAEWLRALSDLVSIGALKENMLPEDLAVIAEVLADYLEDPRPVRSVGSPGGYVAAFRECLAAVHRVIEDNAGLDYDSPRGLEGISPATPRLLAGAMEHAIRAQQDAAAGAS